mgnify:FL=1
MIKIINNVIKPAKLKQFKECVDNVEFPFYLRKHPVTGSKQTDYVFEHCLIKKKEDRKDPLNSNWANFFINVFQDFCTKYKIKNTEIYRASVNLTFANGYKKCDIHTDHPYDHRQLIIYLNNPDPASTTIILDKNKKILKEIAPKENRGVFFDSHFHYHNYPKKGWRMALVFTFK